MNEKTLKNKVKLKMNEKLKKNKMKLKMNKKIETYHCYSL